PTSTLSPYTTLFRSLSPLLQPPTVTLASVEHRGDGMGESAGAASRRAAWIGLLAAALTGVQACGPANGGGQAAQLSPAQLCLQRSEEHTSELQSRSD